MPTMHVSVLMYGYVEASLRIILLLTIERDNHNNRNRKMIKASSSLHKRVSVYADKPTTIVII